MRNLVLLGAGGHSYVIYDALKAMNSDMRIATVLDDNKELWGNRFNDCLIDGPFEKISNIKADGIVIAIGNNYARKRVFEIAKTAEIPFVNVIHPRAVIGGNVTFGEGIVIFANVVVNNGVTIGDNVILNTSCTIDHHCVIGAHAHIAPGVHLAGGVTVGEGTFIGIGAVAIPKITIGSWTIIGAGGVVIRDIPAAVTAVGVPAEIK
jgi:acetyltransferase EpsM